jgi:hypothetical protein
MADRNGKILMELVKKPGEKDSVAETEPEP